MEKNLKNYKHIATRLVSMELCKLSLKLSRKTVETELNPARH